MFVYYVMNESRHSTHSIEPFNIFQNWPLDEAVEKEIRRYLRAPKKYHTTKNYADLYGFDALCEEIRSLIMWQEWSRCEYEIIVKSLFDRSGETERKIDCYEQTLPNMPMITRELIWQYKQAKNEKINEQKS